MWCLISVFVFENGFALGSPQTRPCACRYILRFASPAVTSFRANEAKAILTELYGKADGEQVLDSWMKHRRDHVLKVMLESVAKNLAPTPHVAMAEAEYMAEFIEHTKKVRAHLALKQSNSKV